MSARPAPTARDLAVEALATAIVAAILLGPFLGVRLGPGPDGPALTPSPLPALWAVLLVTLGRVWIRASVTPRAVRALAVAAPLLALATVVGGGLGAGGLLDEGPAFWAGLAVAAAGTLAAWVRLRGERTQATSAPWSPVALAPLPRHRLVVAVSILLVLAALAAPLIPGIERRTIETLTTIAIYVILGWGLNLTVGMVGLLDLGFAAFFALGAYTSAILGKSFGLSFWEVLPLAALVPAAVAAVLGSPVLRLRGDYFAIVTLALGEVVRILLINLRGLTGGPSGITSGVPRPDLFGFASFERRPRDGQTPVHELLGVPYDNDHRLAFILWLSVGVALLVNALILRLRRGALGRAWEAIREDETAAQALGLDRTRLKLIAWSLAAALGGLAGALLAAQQGNVFPENFRFVESAHILAIVVLGGMGSQLGIVLGAILLVGVPELVRGLDQYRMLAFGAAMVAVMLVRPRGLLAHREPTVRLATGGAPRDGGGG